VSSEDEQQDPILSDRGLSRWICCVRAGKIMAQKGLSPKELIAAKNAAKAQSKSDSAPSSPAPSIESKTIETTTVPQTPPLQKTLLNEQCSPLKDSPMSSDLSLTLECVRQVKCLLLSLLNQV
jgi:hypothetical protein